MFRVPSRSHLRLAAPAALAAALAALPCALTAHPHIFVDTALRLVTDDSGRLAGLEVTWEYDELYSLLVFEDMGLDPDYDGRLTEDELAKLGGFDMHWIDGYDGDLHMTAGDGPLIPGPPRPLATEVRDGRIVTRHLRPIGPFASGVMQIRVFDPTFYTAYDLTGGIEVPDRCRVEVTRADMDEAQKTLQDELDRMESEDPEDFPEVGAVFADTVTVTCARVG